jgi:hypothetical protein
MTPLMHITTARRRLSARTPAILQTAAAALAAWYLCILLGLAGADAIIHFIGTGAPQLAVMVVLAMSVAVLLNGSEARARAGADRERAGQRRRRPRRAVADPSPRDRGAPARARRRAGHPP